MNRKRSSAISFGSSVARLGDVTSHGGTITIGCPTVLIGGLPAARVGDMGVCPLVTGIVPHVGGPIMPPGCPTVLIGGMPVAHVGASAQCIGQLANVATGCPTVTIGVWSLERHLQLLGHDLPEVRREAVDRISRNAWPDDPDANSALFSKLDDEDDEVRKSVHAALHILRGRAQQGQHNSMAEPFRFDNYARHKRRDGDNDVDYYEWEIFMDEPRRRLDAVESVRYCLHPTFNRLVQVATNRHDRFALTSSGWGTFTLIIEIQQKDKNRVYTTYQLSFNKPWPAKR